MSEEEHKHQLVRENSTLQQQVKELQGALQELGAEFQTLQLIQSRHGDRKWDKDRDVIACTNCRRSFSINIRKVCASEMRDVVTITAVNLTCRLMVLLYVIGFDYASPQLMSSNNYVGPCPPYIINQFMITHALL